MITFTKKTAKGMEAFKNAIRQQIIEMAADVISPIYGNWEAFDEEIAHKLDTGEIELSEAEKLFAEDFYREELDSMETRKNSVVLRDKFNVDGTMSDGSYELDEMVKGLRKLYPDVEVFGTGWIDYHYGGETYILIAFGDSVVYSNDLEVEESWLSYLERLSSGETIEDFTEEDDEFSVEELFNGIENYLSKHGLKLTVKELVEKMGLVSLEYLFE